MKVERMTRMRARGGRYEWVGCLNIALFGLTYQRQIGLMKYVHTNTKLYDLTCFDRTVSMHSGFKYGVIA
jgi:hypothetical protein